MLSLPSPAKTEWLSMLPQGDQTESNTYNNKNCIVSVENPIHLYFWMQCWEKTERCTSAVLNWWAENQKWVMEAREKNTMLNVNNTVQLFKEYASHIFCGWRQMLKTTNKSVQGKKRTEKNETTCKCLVWFAQAIIWALLLKSHWYVYALNALLIFSLIQYLAQHLFYALSE